jgi:hypothetical protein
LSMYLRKFPVRDAVVTSSENFIILKNTTLYSNTGGFL